MSERGVSDIFQYLIGSCLVILISSCTEPKQNEGGDNFDSDLIIKEIENAVWAFHAADTSRNAKAVIDLLWPEYTMLADGNRISYGDVVEGSPKFMSGLTLFHTEWTDLQIIPLAHDAGLSSFLFRDSIVTKAGEVSLARGPNTFLWQKRDGVWKVLYGDADHYDMGRDQ